MNRKVAKKYGRRKAGTWGRTHGPSRGDSKKAANKATRAVPPISPVMSDDEWAERWENLDS